MVIQQDIIERIESTFKTLGEQERKKIVFLASKKSELLAREFNTISLNLFEIIKKYSEKYKMQDRFTKLGTYEFLYKTVIQGKEEVPILKYITIVLEHSKSIIEGNADYFLQMDIPVVNGKVNDQTFEIVGSESFKDLYRKMLNNERTFIHSQMVFLTNYAFAFFYNYIIECAKKNN